MIWSFTMIIFLKESLIYYKMHLFGRVFLLLISVICKSDLTDYHFIMLFALLMSEGLTVITRFLWPPSS